MAAWPIRTRVGSDHLRSIMVKKVLARLAEPKRTRHDPGDAMPSLHRDTRADRAAHAGAAEAAIAHRVLGQILLVIVLGEIEWRRVQDLGRDRVEALRLELLLVHRLRGLGGLALGGIE